MCQSETITRRQYEAFLEVLKLMKDIKEIQALPPKVDTLKRMATAALPLLPLRQLEVALNPDKLPSYAAGQKKGKRIQNEEDEQRLAENPATAIEPPKGRVTFFDSIPFFSALLSTPRVVEKVHFGMAEWVDTPQELYHSYSWATSIRAAGKDHARYPDGTPLFPSDFVDFVCNNGLCSCHNGDNGRPHLGRVHSVGRDLRTQSLYQGQVVIRVQEVVTVNALPQSVKEAASKAKKPVTRNEAILIEDQMKDMPEKSVLRRRSYRIDSHFDNGIGLDNPYTPDVIRRIANIKASSLRSAWQSSPLNGELEVEAYTREYWVEKAPTLLSLPLIWFMDGFGTYRNTHRTATGVY
jgi:hypothetical protein